MKRTSAFYKNSFEELINTPVSIVDEEGVFFYVKYRTPGLDGIPADNNEERGVDKAFRYTWQKDATTAPSIKDDNFRVLKSAHTGFWVLTSIETEYTHWYQYCEPSSIATIAKCQQYAYNHGNPGISLSSLVDTTITDRQIDDVLVANTTGWTNSNKLSLETIRIVGEGIASDGYFRYDGNDMFVFVQGAWHSITQGTGSAVAHQHYTSDIIDFAVSWNDISNIPSNLVYEGHTHTSADILDFDVLGDKADREHYHTLDHVSNLIDVLDNKANANHTQDISTINGLQAILDHKAGLVHTQDISTINGLQNLLDTMQSAIETLEANQNTMITYNSISKDITNISETYTDKTNPYVIVLSGTITITDNGNTIALPYDANDLTVFSWGQTGKISTFTVDATNGEARVVYLEEVP